MGIIFYHTTYLSKYFCLSPDWPWIFITSSDIWNILTIFNHCLRYLLLFRLQKLSNKKKNYNSLRNYSNEQLSYCPNSSKKKSLKFQVSFLHYSNYQHVTRILKKYIPEESNILRNRGAVIDFPNPLNRHGNIYWIKQGNQFRCHME